MHRAEIRIVSFDMFSIRYDRRCRQNEDKSNYQTEMKLFHVVLAAAVLYMIQVGVEAEESAAETGPGILPPPNKNWDSHPDCRGGRFNRNCHHLRQRGALPTQTKSSG
ncbi:hypothetical protein PHYSODRAFT_307038 [Phytophthora sojae]|uniref:Uncharacterized protein n=1 Tax=Phytophthora sojae (strain P6497) TaxID=1094619 RepID=G5ACA3_PHYSP|nr:hypothetical protein PHYSODRAFT_307038 [Phytophthora sojae]EGZ06977.1 hypothetical protein PHYSODRAFT_307038 [Phytophthora sojae]|eukprot:XP_009537741.1 hypothetical protein PHYSODRAFT_307038 [Phytophthora sojae]